MSPEGGRPTKVGFQNRDQGVDFTTRKGAQVPDLIVATDQSTCAANTQTQTYNVTGTVDIFRPELDGTCAVLSSTSPSPAPNPCGAKIDAAAASSISAAVTARVCAFPDPQVSCPSKSQATGRSLGGLGGLVATVGWITCLILL